MAEAVGEELKKKKRRQKVGVPAFGGALLGTSGPHSVVVAVVVVDT
jgi:hypothetical protein